MSKVWFVVFVCMLVCKMAHAVQPDCGGNNTCGRWLESQGTFACEGSWCMCNYKQYTCGCEYDFDCSLTGGAGVIYGCFNNKCEPCKTCSDCETSAWYSNGTGYQQQDYKWCSCDGTCSSTKNYRCAPGYYGTTRNGTTGCTMCPMDNTTYATSAAGSINKTDCYIPKNSSITDTTGSYTYSSDCAWTN